MKTDAIALTGGVRLDGMADVFRLADALAHADGFVPRHLVGKPAAIAAVVLTGIELGIGPMEAMRGIHVVDGKPTLAAEMMLARARRAGVKTRWLETTDKVARLAVTVPGDDEPQVMVFTWDDAIRAGVAGKENWKRHPAPMLRARCTSAAMRAFCPEVLGACVYESDSGELTNGDPPAVSVESAPTPSHALLAPAEAVTDEDAAAIAAELERASTPEDLAAARAEWSRRVSSATPSQKAAVAAAGRAAVERISGSRVNGAEKDRST